MRLSNTGNGRPAIFTTHPDAESMVSSGSEWDFHNVGTTEHLHGLHPYPAKFIPQVPRKAIQEWSSPGSLVLDPFVGCGTTLLEASLLGRRSVGVDNNAVAVLVSRAKTASYSRRDLANLQSFQSRLPEVLATAKPRPDLVPSNENFHYWFDEPVVERLATIKGLVLREAEPVQTLLMAALSAIIVRVSFQDSDTRYKRVERAVSPLDVDRAFASRVAFSVEQLEKLPATKRAPSEVRHADSRSLSFLADGSVDLIVTSPPYLNAYDYHKYHRQRLHVIDGDFEFARDAEIGKHDDFTRRGATPDNYFKDMAACFSEWQRVLKPGGKCVVLIGDAIVSTQPVYVGDTFVEQLAERGIKLERRWIRQLQPTKRSFNVKNSRMSHEHVLLLSKGSNKKLGLSRRL